MRNFCSVELARLRSDGFRALAWATLLLFFLGGTVYLAEDKLILAVFKMLAGAPLFLGLLIGAYSAAFFLRALAWRALLPPGAPAVGTLLRQLMVALFVNHILPVNLGEVARIYLARRARVPLSAAVSSVVLARTIDLGSLALLACLGGLFIPEAVSWSQPAALLAAAWIALALIWFVFWPRLRGTYRAEAFPSGGIRSLLARAVDSVRPPQLIWATCMTLPSWALEASVLWTVMRLLGHPISPMASVAVTALVLLGQVVRFTPGGVGTYELSMSTALALLGQPAEVALGAAVLTHGFKFAYAYAIGGGALWWELPRSWNSPS